MNPAFQSQNNLAELFGTHAPASFLTTVPEGSGAIRVTAGPSVYNPFFVSRNAGRWNKHGESTLYFGYDLDVCLQECGYDSDPPPDACTVEFCRTNRDFMVFDISKLPDEYRTPIYENIDPSAKWEHSHQLLQEVRSRDGFGQVCGIVAPSASGIVTNAGGMCVAVPHALSLFTVEGTGTYDDYRSGRINWT